MSSLSPYISVIIPVYQAQTYLRNCLDCLIAQTEANWEAICINDGSTDESADILSEYAARDARFRIIHQENAGVSAARNAGLDAAKGKHVLFIDHDDWLLPHSLADLLAAQRTRPHHWIMFGVRAFFEDGSRPAYHQGVYRYAQLCEPCTCALNRHLLVNMYAYVWNKLFSLDLIQAHRVRFPEGIALNEDHYFVLHYALHVERCYLIPDSLYQYRQHGESVSGGFDRMDRPAQDYLNHITLYEPLMAQLGDLPRAKRACWQLSLLARVFFEYRHILAWMRDRSHPRPEVEAQLHLAMARFFKLAPLRARVELQLLRLYRRYLLKR